MKFFWDTAAAILLLMVLSPVLWLVWLLVLVVDGRPVFFRQVRVGKGGEDFVLLKFRTMAPKPDAEKGAFDAGDASRVTALGNILRKTKLDELPQLWNVLRGDMAIVGPRPEVRRWVNAYPDRWERILQVRPGITDPASIVYRDEETILAAAPDPEACYRERILPHKLDFYEAYVAHQSLRGDLRIIVKTIAAVLRPGTARKGEGRRR